MSHAAPAIVTLITDFGVDDFYVGALKGAILRNCRDAALIDITHAVPRQDVRFGAIMLERAVDAFPAGTIHLCVVDPGVGTNRRILIARWDRQTVICPDNGLITWAWRRRGEARLWELTWRPPAASNVFHGRDIMGPAAAMLASGLPIEQIARPCDGPVLLDLAPATDPAAGQVIHIDHFGNVTSNLLSADAGNVRGVVVAGREIGPIRQTYGDVPRGQVLALIGSSDLVEIAVRDGSAAATLDLRVGDAVKLIW